MLILATLSLQLTDERGRAEKVWKLWSALLFPVLCHVHGWLRERELTCVRKNIIQILGRSCFWDHYPLLSALKQAVFKWKGWLSRQGAPPTSWTQQADFPLILSLRQLYPSWLRWNPVTTGSWECSTAEAHIAPSPAPACPRLVCMMCCPTHLHLQNTRSKIKLVRILEQLQQSIKPPSKWRPYATTAAVCPTKPAVLPVFGDKLTLTSQCSVLSGSSRQQGGAHRTVTSQPL